MSTDWREKEREFLTGLKADTGRDLTEWMRVIAAQNLPHRNDIIDWLRQQGFLFARASWLERVHHNAGRPIYCDPADLVADRAVADAVEADIEVARIAAGGGGRSYVMPTAADYSAGSSGQVAKAERKPATPATPRLAAEGRVRSDTAPATGEMPGPAAITPETGAGADPCIGHDVHTASEVGTAPEVPEARDASAPAADPAPVSAADLSSPAPAAPVSGSPLTETTAACVGGVPAPATAAGPQAIDEVLAKAKAYRPLAQHLLKVVGATVPSLELGAAASHISLSAGGRGFGLIAVSARDIRLVLRLDAGAECPGFGPVKLPAGLSRAAQGLTHMAVLSDARRIDEALINLVRRAAGL